MFIILDLIQDIVGAVKLTYGVASVKEIFIVVVNRVLSVPPVLFRYLRFPVQDVVELVVSEVERVVRRFLLPSLLGLD